MDENSIRRPHKNTNNKRFGAEKYKKFIGNKSEGQGFADNRKRKIQHEYMKILSKQKKKEEYQTKQKLGKNNRHTQKETSSSDAEKVTKFSKSKWQFEEKKAEKARKKTEALKKKREREEALAKYNDKKHQKNKTFSKRTRKGQPVMRNQIEFLLTKIEKQVNKT
ncbi:thyroid transcription factor 1-associated protein 26 homolog [Argopecten irradians]|uniref:thyroid transcription factor 1-associated protein 26 homolog n=1 Tax=Argopecten irradians TaxID=31199 RepID=UPI0037147237